MIEIRLNKGYLTAIDDADADLATFKWYVYEKPYGNYARRKFQVNKKLTNVSLHRTILERIIGRPLKTTEQVDHIDGNGLNNQRSNLRIATQTQNNRNKATPKNNTSGFKGVVWHRKCQRWQAQLQVHGKKIYLGLFDKLEDAHQAYLDAARKHFGEFNRE